MNDIIVLGGGGHAKVLISILKKNNNYNILGYVDFQDNGEILGKKYLGDESILQNRDNLSLAIGIGSVKRNVNRYNLYKSFLEKGFHFPFVQSITAIVNEEVAIGGGTFIGDGVIINSGTVIKEASILNTKCSIDHDCVIGNNVHIAPGVTISGIVTIGDNCLIGTGSSIKQCIKICDDVVIGAGSVVIKDINEPGVYVGSPLRRLDVF